MLVTFYKRPYGQIIVVKIKNVHPEDEKYFKDNGISISMEETGQSGIFIVYAELPDLDEDGEQVELIEISSGRTCEETLKALALECKNFYQEKTK